MDTFDLFLKRQRQRIRRNLIQAKKRIDAARPDMILEESRHAPGAPLVSVSGVDPNVALGDKVRL